MEQHFLPSTIGGYEETTIGLHVIAILLLSSLLILVLPRKYSVILFLFISMIIPMNQQIVILGLNFTVMRSLLLVCWIRLLVRAEFNYIKFNLIDGLFLTWVISCSCIFILQWESWGAFVNRLGFAFNALGIYFLLRFYFVDYERVTLVVQTFAFFAICTAIAMLLEKATGYNAFSLLGGLREYSMIRDDTIRAQGPFSHPILAGTFGATAIPFLFSLWQDDPYKKVLLAVSLTAALIITITSASAGPFLAFASGLMAICLWPLRAYRRYFKWIFASFVVFLSIIMNAPVWGIISRIDIIKSASSYHRFMLVDSFIKRIDEWWLLGLKSTAHWGWMMGDLANQYVYEGIQGGILTFILFLLLILFCFFRISAVIDSQADHTKTRFFTWAIGSTLFVHVIAFWGISYWDQLLVTWYTLLAIVASLDAELFNDSTAAKEVDDLF
jgi:hypothetical protein